MKLLRYAGIIALPALLAAQTSQTAQTPQAAQTAQPSQAAQAAQNNEPGITRQQADDILDELRQIRQLLEKQQRAANEDEKPKRATLNLKGLEPLGKKNAPITMVEFTDYQCQFCQHFNTATFGELKRNFIDTGKVRFYSRDLPLDFHENAFRAAQAGRCAGDQGKFWQFRDIMGAHPDKLEMSDLLESASQLNMDANKFRACIESGKYKSKVESDMVEGMKIGADGTPTFVIGKSTPDGVEGELIVGALPYATFAGKIEELGAK